MPNRRKLDGYLDGLYRSRWLTNDGPLVQELTARLEDFLGVRNLVLTANGTLALQIAYRALGLGRQPGDNLHEAVTTPFTFAATPHSLSWEGIQPQFEDVLADTLNLDPAKAKRSIGTDTQLVVPVHVYGNPCDVAAFARLAAETSVKVVYDAAHAFGVKVGDHSVLEYGDASILSFHATKLYHTVEGGAVIFRDTDAFEAGRRLLNFGRNPAAAETQCVGINAKLSEVHAAFGLALLDEIDTILDRRRALYEAYVYALGGRVGLPASCGSHKPNGAYMPILLANRAERDRCESALRDADIRSRRYFDASAFLDSRDECPIAWDSSDRVLCLPMYDRLQEKQVRQIVDIVLSALDRKSGTLD